MRGVPVDTGTASDNSRFHKWWGYDEASSICRMAANRRLHTEMETIAYLAYVLGREEEREIAQKNYTRLRVDSSAMVE